MHNLVLNYQTKRFLRYFKSRRTAKLITVGLFFGILFLVGTGIYLFIREGFGYIGAESYFRQAITLYVYEVYLLIVIFLVLFNALIVGLYGIFKGGDNIWVMASPSYASVFRSVFIMTVLSSLWPLFVMALPVLLGVRRVFNLNIVGVFIILVMLVLLTVFLISLFFLLILFLCLLFTKINLFKLTKTRLIIIIVLCGIVLAGFTWQHSINKDLISLFRAEDIESAAVDKSLIESQFKIFPSHLAAVSIHAWQNSNMRTVYVNFFVLLLISVFSVLLYWKVSSRLFYFWQIFQEGGFTAGTRGKIKRPRHSPRFSSGPVNALFKKEAIIAMRDSRSFLWFGFLVFVWLVQTGFNIVLARNIRKYNIDYGGLPVMLQVLQFATTIFFLSAFALRFIFPSFSSERKTAWILLSSPVSMRKVFWAKFLFFLLIFTVLGLIIGYSNLVILGLPLGPAGIALIIFLASIFFIVSFSLSLGVLFPNFETDDPSVLSTSLPGLAFIFGSLAYGAYGGYSLFRSISSGNFSPLFLFVVYSLLGSALFLFLASRRRSIDFVRSNRN